MGSLPEGAPPIDSPKVERNRTYGSDGFARQCALVSDSSNDEQWSGDLPNVITLDSQSGIAVTASTNLSLCENGQEDIRSGSSKNQQRGHSIKRRTLNEHGDDGPVQSTDSPVAARMFLLCRMSKMTIMRVRRILSETEIAK